MTKVTQRDAKLPNGEGQAARVWVYERCECASGHPQGEGFENKPPRLLNVNIGEL